MYGSMCVCVCVCLLKKGSISFDPNNAKFSQKINECSGHVNRCIRPKTVQNWLKNDFLKRGQSIFNFAQLALVEIGQDFTVEFSFVVHLQDNYLNSYPYRGVYLFIYYLMLYVCMCVRLSLCLL